MRVTKADREESLERLREWVKPGDTLTTVLRHTSTSGMMRSIDVYLLGCEKGKPTKLWLSYHAARILGWSFDERREAVKVSGVGMDMGFHLVYSLASAVFPDPFRCTGKTCPSNAHNNKPYPPRDGRMKHPGGGYSLRQTWL